MNKQMKPKQNKGITLIALVVTIIVLLILAGVAISAITGNENAMEKAKQAKVESETADENDTIKLAVVNAVAKGTNGKIESQYLKEELEGLVTSTGEIEDNSIGPWTVQAKKSKIAYEINQYGVVEKLTVVTLDETDTLKTVSVKTFAALKYYNEYVEGKNLKAVKGTGINQQQIVIPAGFKVVEGDKLEEGMVIRNIADDNEFVWIPINQTLTFANNTTGSITLGRYSTDANGTNACVANNNGVYIPTATSSVAIKCGSNTYSENDDSVTSFVESATQNKGYYIARYEAGVEGTENIDSDTNETYTIGSTTFTKNNNTEASKLTSKSGMAVWNKISKNNAKAICEAKYSGHSALMNSYAWDTAIIFIQQCSGIADYYSKYDGTGLICKTGEEVTSAGIADENCHIRGMASNLVEFSTENSNLSDYSSVSRGGRFYSTDYYTSYRVNINGNPGFTIGFRPIYYL